MSAFKGYYSLVQYCPNMDRCEAVNVGVVLFCPERQFIRAQITESLDRVYRVFGPGVETPQHLRSMVNALRTRLELEQAEFKTLADLQKFVFTRANKVLLTSPKPVIVVEPEAELAALFSELVAMPANSLAA